MSYTIATHAAGTPWGALDVPHPVSGYTVVTPTVVMQGWSFSTMYPANDGSLRYEVKALDTYGNPHALTGQRFDTQDDARRAGYEAGILGYFVRDES